jgi:hypothetical protein
MNMPGKQNLKLHSRSAAQPICRSRIGRIADGFHVTAAQKNRDDLHVGQAFRVDVFDRSL